MTFKWNTLKIDVRREIRSKEKERTFLENALYVLFVKYSLYIICICSVLVGETVSTEESLTKKVRVRTDDVLNRNILEFLNSHSNDIYQT